MMKYVLPKTTKRVAKSTNPNVNACIRNKTIEKLNHYKDSNYELLTDRMEQLDREWDTERFLETNAASLILLSSILGFKSNKCWFFVTGAISVFLLQHGLLGWCPPISFIRNSGVRTAEEIFHEKMVLKVFRGDFSQINKDVNEMLQNVEK